MEIEYFAENLKPCRLLADIVYTLKRGSAVKFGNACITTRYGTRVWIVRISVAVGNVWDLQRTADGEGHQPKHNHYRKHTTDFQLRHCTLLRYKCPKRISKSSVKYIA